MPARKIVPGPQPTFRQGKEHVPPEPQDTVPGVFIQSPGSRPFPGAFAVGAGTPGARKMGKSWEEFEAKAAEAAAARAVEWGLSQQWGPPVRCVFLGPASGDAERPSIGYQQKVRFRWTISVPDAPPGVAHEQEVAAQANYVFMEERGIPVPAAWKSLEFGAQVQRAQAKAQEEVPDHPCTVYGLRRSTPAAAAAATATTARTPGPRTGETWVFREPNDGRAEVWVAAHHAADSWWCVKAPRRCVAPEVGRPAGAPAAPCTEKPMPR